MLIYMVAQALLQSMLSMSFDICSYVTYGMMCYVMKAMKPGNTSCPAAPKKPTKMIKSLINKIK